MVYADKQTLEENIVRKHMACIMVDEDTGEILEPSAGTEPFMQYRITVLCLRMLKT